MRINKINLQQMRKKIAVYVQKAFMETIRNHKKLQ